MQLNLEQQKNDRVILRLSIQKGSVIRPGQKLGEFIQPSVFELEAPINVKDINFLTQGDKVTLLSDDISGSWEGKVKRIGKNIDSKTQSVTVYIAVTASDLKEGMYLKGTIESKKVPESVSIPRKILNADGSIYVIVNNTLKKKFPKVEKINESSVLLTGIEQEDQILSENFIGAYEGLKVVISK